MQRGQRRNERGGRRRTCESGEADSAKFARCQLAKEKESRKETYRTMTFVFFHHILRLEDCIERQASDL